MHNFVKARYGAAQSVLFSQSRGQRQRGFRDIANPLELRSRHRIVGHARLPVLNGSSLRARLRHATDSLAI